MNNSKSQKAVYIVISVLVAFVFWLYVDNTGSGERDIRLYNIPVTFVGESEELADRGLMLVSGDDTTIDLRLQGRLSVISKINKNNIKIQVDVSNIISTGAHTLNYKLVYPDNVSQNSVSVVSASLYAVTVEVGELYSKSIEIMADVNGAVADGYMLHECKITPEKLVISGREEDVNKIDHALVEISLQNATTSYSEYLHYTLIDTDGNAVNNDKIKVSEDKVCVEVPVVILREIPLDVEFIENGGSSKDNIDYSIVPESIMVSGEEQALDKLESITLEKIDLSRLMGDETLEFEIPIPGGCINESGTNTAKVKIQFKGVTTKTYECGNITFSNVPEGYKITAVTRAIDVTLRGKQEILDQLDGNDIRIVVDLADKTPANGTYTEKAKVCVEGGDDVGAIGTYQIGYRLKKG